MVGGRGGGGGVGFFGGLGGEDVKCIRKSIRNCRKSAFLIEWKCFFFLRQRWHDD